MTLKVSLTGYTDAGSNSGYAVQAVNWAVDQGAINETSTTTLSHSGSAMRAQVAVILARFCEQDS